MLKLINLCYKLAGLYITVPEGYEVDFIRKKFLSDNALMIKPANKNHHIVYYAEDDCPATKVGMIESQRSLLKKYIRSKRSRLTACSDTSPPITPGNNSVVKRDFR